MMLTETRSELAVRRATAEIGAEVDGVEARHAGATEIEALKQALAEHGVIVLRDQSLSPAEFTRFGRQFGEIELSVRGLYTLPEQPEVYVISNVLDEQGKPIGNPNDGYNWHTDLSFMEYPTAYTFLYAIETPPVGSDTQFASAFHAYDELAPEERERLGRIRVVHSHTRLHASRKWAPPLTDEAKARTPDVTHPLIRCHPLTGRKAVYLGSQNSFYPVGMNDDERLALLADLVTRATRPDYVYSHKWRPRDLVIWDNRGLLHRATPFDKQRHRRVMHRISVRGERPFS